MKEEEQKELVKALAEAIGESGEAIRKGKSGYWLIPINHDVAVDWEMAINETFVRALNRRDIEEVCAATYNKDGDFIAVFPNTLDMLTKDSFLKILNNETINIKKEFLIIQEKRKTPDRIEKILKERMNGNLGPLDRGWGPRD